MQQHNIFGPTQSYPFTKLESYMIGSAFDSRKAQDQDDTPYDYYQAFLTNGDVDFNISILNKEASIMPTISHYVHLKNEQAKALQEERKNLGETQNTSDFN